MVALSSRANISGSGAGTSKRFEEVSCSRPLTLWWPETRLGSENRRWPQSHRSSHPRCERMGKPQIWRFLPKLGFATDSAIWGGISWGTWAMRTSSPVFQPPDERNSPLGTKARERWCWEYKYMHHRNGRLVIHTPLIFLQTSGQTRRKIEIFTTQKY